MNRLRNAIDEDDDDDGDNGEGRWQRACRPLTSNCFALITENNDLRPDNPGWIRQTKSTSGTNEVPERQMRVAADEIKQRTRQGRNKKGGRKKEKKRRKRRKKERKRKETHIKKQSPRETERAISAGFALRENQGQRRETQRRARCTI
ncbi:hypothetical protein HN011_009821 [Eciton burchellii]|nr:hypothetical protein HN011_009821 [Eciton burchellii]